VVKLGKKINEAISSTSARFIFEAIQSYELLQSLTEMYNTKLHRVHEQKKEPKERKREELTEAAASLLSCLTGESDGNSCEANQPTLLTSKHH